MFSDPLASLSSLRIHPWFEDGAFAHACTSGITLKARKSRGGSPTVFVDVAATANVGWVFHLTVAWSHEPFAATRCTPYVRCVPVLPSNSSRVAPVMVENCGIVERSN